MINIKPGAEHEEVIVIGLARQNVNQARPAVLPDTHFVLARPITINSSAGSSILLPGFIYLQTVKQVIGL